MMNISSKPNKLIYGQGRCNHIDHTLKFITRIFQIKLKVFHTNAEFKELWLYILSQMDPYQKLN